MSDQQFHDLVHQKKYAAAQKFLDSCDDDEAKEELAKRVGYNSCECGEHHATVLMLAAYYGDAPDELIRSMIKRGPHNYINEEDEECFEETAAIYAAENGRATLLELLLTLGADPQGCRISLYRRVSEDCLRVLASIALRSAPLSLAASVITMSYIRNLLSSSTLISQSSIPSPRSSMIFTASMEKCTASPA
jgi:ankyrin repeat protein